MIMYLHIIEKFKNIKTIENKTNAPNIDCLYMC